MITRFRLSSFYFRCAILVLPVVALTAANYVCLMSGHPIHPSSFGSVANIELAVFTTVAWAIASKKDGLCDLTTVHCRSFIVWRAVLATAVAYTAVVMAMFLMHRSDEYSRIVIVASALILIVLAVTLVPSLWRRAAYGDADARHPRVVVVGTDAYAKRVARHLSEMPPWNAIICCFVRLPGQRIAVDVNQVIEVEDLLRFVQDGKVDSVVVALRLSQLLQAECVLRLAGRLCVPISMVLNLGRQIELGERTIPLGAYQMIELERTPADSINYVLFKRLFDVMFALIALITMSPFMAMIALVIRCTSPGPAIFKQKRVGLNNRAFWMFKFRTMRVSQNWASDTVWTTAQDDRCTPFGCFLRRTSLDELPQFLNVLRGEMSVVGPRPERPHFVQKFASIYGRYNRRHRLKVGITGWAQVKGYRGDTSISKRVRCDLYYLKNWSFLFDMKIIALTAVSGLFDKNAY